MHEKQWSGVDNFFFGRATFKKIFWFVGLCVLSFFLSTSIHAVVPRSTICCIIRHYEIQIPWQRFLYNLIIYDAIHNCLLALTTYPGLFLVNYLTKPIGLSPPNFTEPDGKTASPTRNNHHYQFPNHVSLHHSTGIYQWLFCISVHRNTRVAYKRENHYMWTFFYHQHQTNLYCICVKTKLNTRFP